MTLRRATAAERNLRRPATSTTAGEICSAPSRADAAAQSRPPHAFHTRPRRRGTHCRFSTRAGSARLPQTCARKRHQLFVPGRLATGRGARPRPPAPWAHASAAARPESLSQGQAAKFRGTFLVTPSPSSKQSFRFAKFSDLEPVSRSLCTNESLWFRCDHVIIFHVIIFPQGISVLNPSSSLELTEDFLRFWKITLR